MKNPNFVQELIDICDRYGDIRRYIETELTETAVTENAGILKIFKVDTLKLDQSFFDQNKEEPRGNIVISGIIDMAHELDMTVVAEGIEFSKQFEFLQIRKYNKRGRKTLFC